MIPIGDEGTPGRRIFPIVNVTIIVLNILMFVYQLATGLDGGPITYGWSLIPAEITSGQDLVGEVQVPGTGFSIPLYEAPAGIPYLTLLTSMFMHGGFLHIASNMLFLFIFGDNVEDNMGSAKYLIFYLVSGFAASFAQIFMGGSGSVIPNLGASGAVAGVLAGYLVLFPGARIRTLIPIFGFMTISTVPAIFMIGFWIVTQFLSVAVIGEQAGGPGGGVAYWAHIGGFIAGLLLVFILGRRGTERGFPAFSR